MTLLAADIGNSHTFVGLLDGEDVVADWRVATDERRTSDEWAVLIRGLDLVRGQHQRRHVEAAVQHIADPRLPPDRHPLRHQGGDVAVD